MTLESLLSRADPVTLGKLVGNQALRLLNSLDPLLVQPSRMVSMLLDLHSEVDLLRNPDSRQALLGLLRPPEAVQLCVHLGLDSESPYLAILQEKYRKGSQIERLLFAYFEVAAPSDVSGAQGNPDCEEVQAGSELFPHQRMAARAVDACLSPPSGRVVLHMPTGSGKTRTAMHILCDHLRRTEPTLVAWLAYSEELCSQAAVEFQEAWVQLGNRPLNLFRFWGDHDHTPKPGQDGLLIAGLAKAYCRTLRESNWLFRLADQVSLVVIDEAHQAIAPTYSLVLQSLVVKKPSTSLLGLTATPGRTWNDLDEDERLADFFGRKKVVLEVAGFANPMDYLVEAGYLARPCFEALNHSGCEVLSRQDIKELTEALDIPPRILRRLAEDEQRNLKIVSAVERLARSHRRILVFSATADHARLLAAILKARGLTAHSVTAQTSGHERRNIISAYRARTDRTRVLVNYGVLTAGFDAPQTSAAVIARPTKSLVLYCQMVGRATRGVLAGGNRSAQILTVVDAGLPGFGNMAEAFYNWEDVW